MGYEDFQRAIVDTSANAVFHKVWRYFKKACIVESVDKVGKLFDENSLASFCKNLNFGATLEDIQFILSDELKIDKYGRFELMHFLQAIRLLCPLALRDLRTRRMHRYVLHQEDLLL